MNRERGSEGKAGSAAYAVVALILWALVLYSLSPLNRPEPTRLAAKDAGSTGCAR